MRLSFASLSLAAATFGVAPVAVAETAQTAAASVGELVVTARKRPERLALVPIAVSVIDAGTIRARGGATDAEALLSGAPGLRFNNTASPTTSEMSLRGSGTARATSADSGVGLYRDGVYVAGGLQFSRNFMRIDTFDLQRAEVLRGTVGALYGRNAVGGAINLISAPPVFRREGWAQVEYGATLDRKQVQAVVNAPLGASFAVRFGVDYMDQDKGFFRNRTFGNYLDAQHGLGLRGQLRMVRGPLDVTLLVEHQKLDTSNVAFQIDVPPTPPLFPLGYVSDPYAVDWSIPGSADTELTGAVLTARYDLGWGLLTSVTSLRRRKVMVVSDIDGFTAASLAAERARGNPATTTDPNTSQTAADTTQTIFQEVHLTGGAHGFAWLAGAEYLKLGSDFYLAQTRTPTRANPTLGADRTMTQTWESAAAFGSLGYDVARRLNLTIEGRYTADDKRYTQRGFLLGTTTPAIPASVGGASPDNLAYNALLSWRTRPGLMTYVKAGSAYRVGGFNASIGDPRQPKPVPPTYGNETSTTYEAGAKAYAGARFYGAVAAYLTHVDDVIVLDNNGCAPSNPVCPIASTNFVSNGGEGRIWGLEAEAVWRGAWAGGQLTARASASRQAGRFTAGLYQGLKVPQAPDWIASANLDFRHPLPDGLAVFGNLNYSAQWGGVQDVIAPIFKLQDRQVADLRAGLESGPWQGAVFARNLTDARYYLVRQVSTRRWADRRSIGLQLRYGW
ncbi:TonB-dependent receptor [Phenylobacterium sp.]|jgi:iron complex outermembrane receptor protein|uniref:TonB-dependent receptor n=1 Tax=Phenylobacterium sp. TaxID=1871053 RepID=UPI002F3E98C9